MADVKMTKAMYFAEVKAIVEGTPKTVAVCSRCLRSGKVNRA